MRIEFLYWPDCPSHPKALADLRSAMAELEIDSSQLSVREIATEEQASAASFPGSPTIRVDSDDVEPSGEVPQLSCRIYRRSDGRVSPTPDPAKVRAALAAARSTDNERKR